MKKPPYCKHCGLSLKGAKPLQPFSEVYLRLCPVRDGDMCERHKTVAKTKKTARIKALPKQIYVVREADRDETYLVVHEDYDTIDDALKVGIYELKETVTKVIQHSLE